jgi:hypothetical protein
MLFGNVDKSGTITDENGIFFYPGFELAITGKFEQNFLKSGRLAKIKGEKCENGLKVVELYDLVKKLNILNKGQHKAYIGVKFRKRSETVNLEHKEG